MSAALAVGMQTTKRSALRSILRIGRTASLALLMLAPGTLTGCQVDESESDADDEQVDESEDALAAEWVNIDFGVDTVAVPSGWNDGQALLKSGRMPLKTSTGKRTTYNFKQVARWNGTQPYGTTAASASLGFPVAATQDGVWGSTLSYQGFAAPKAIMEMSGLNPNVTYTFQFFSSIDKGDSYNRDTRYRLVGATTVTGNLNPTNNKTLIVSLSAKPNADGIIKIEVEKGAANNTTHGFYHLSSMRMGYTLPGVGTQRLVQKTTSEFGSAPPFGFSEYLPSGYNPNGTATWPLLITLHGIGEAGNGTTQLSKLLASGTGIPAMIDDGVFPAHDRFIVLSPQTSTAVATPAQVKAFLDFAKAKYKVDTKRMYLTGLSLGGRAVWDYVNTYGASTEFAAVTTTPGDGAYDTLDCAKAGRVPMWAFQGAQDTNIYTSPAHAIAAFNAVKNCSTAPVEAPRLTMYQNGTHFIWTPTYSMSGMDQPVDAAYTKYDQDMYSWLLAHKKP